MKYDTKTTRCNIFSAPVNIFYDDAETSLARGSLTPSGPAYVGDVAGTTARVKFVFRTDGVAGGAVVIDNFTVLGFLSGDLDFDGDLDMRDFSEFSLCYAGAGNLPAAGCPEGVDSDFDDDGDVDGDDFASFVESFLGPQ